MIDKIEKFINLCKTYPPDFDKIKEEVKNIDVNFILDDENVLSELILGYGYDSEKISFPGSKYLPEIVKIILENGFDVHRNNDKAGAKCLENLSWSTYDDYILDSAKLLLDAGANPEAEPDDESVLLWVESKMIGDCVCNRNFESSNRYCVMYDILNSKIKGLDYWKIDNYAKCFNKTVNGIYLCYPDNYEGNNNGNTLSIINNEDFNAPLVFDCEGKDFCVHNKYVEAYISPLSIAENTIRLSVTDKDLTELIGHEIVNVQFIPDISKDLCCVILVYFDNNKVLCFEYSKSETYAKIKLTDKIKSKDVNVTRKFEEYLKSKEIKAIHLVDPWVIVNESSGDFDSVVFEFKECIFKISSKMVLKGDFYEMYEFEIAEIDDINEIEDIYKTISDEDGEIKLVTELENEYGIIDGYEISTEEFYLFIFADFPEVVVTASNNEERKYFLYPHKYGDYPFEISYSDDAVLFPEG